MVNIGGFLGTLIAGYLRILDWNYVFLLCAAAIALNFIPLFTFAEPDRAPSEEDSDGPLVLLYRAIRGLLEPRLFFFTIAFAGFWLMFYQLFDILPNFIDDWVDSRSAAAALANVFGESAVPTVNGGNLTQEWMINFNSLLISLFAFAIGYLTGKIRSLHAIVVGIAISAVAIYLLGASMNGLVILAAIGLFSLGEMTASPTKMRYLSSIAPPGKQGQYMGYVNFTVGIGWSLGSVVAGHLYQEGGDKIVLARRYLIEHLGMPSEAVAAIPRGEVLDTLYAKASVDPFAARTLLWDTYEPQSMWLLFALIGLTSMVLLLGYNYVVRRADENPGHSFDVNGTRWVKLALVPVTGALGWATLSSYSHGLLLNTLFFGAMLVVAFVEPAPEAAHP
ncbi:MAG: MFS transporter [Myxococcota bacterium]